MVSAQYMKTSHLMLLFVCTDNAGVIVNPKGEMKGMLFYIE